MSKHIFTIPAISGIEIVSGALELSASILPLARGPAGPPGILGSFTIAELNAAINDADLSPTTHNHTGIYEPLKGADDNYVTDAQLIVIGNTSGINTGDNPGVTSVSGTSPVASSGGNTPTISMPAATNASAGYATAAHIQAIEANTAKISNATHTGDAIGSGSLIVVGINNTNLAGLSTGILKNTTGTGVPSIAVANDFPIFNQNTTGSAATLTTPRSIDGQSFNGSADITVIAPGTHSATSKPTPVDADELPLVDSNASNILKKLTWANLKATLKTYFDTLYATISQTHYVGTTAIAANRASASQQLTGIISIDGNAATVTTNANLTGVITSIGNGTSIASKTGTGNTFVVDTNPTIQTRLTVPEIAGGSASAGNLTIRSTLHGTLGIVNCLGTLKVNSGDILNAAIIKDGNDNSIIRGFRGANYWTDLPVSSTAFQVGTAFDNVVFTTLTSKPAQRMMLHTSALQISNENTTSYVIPTGFFEMFNGSVKIFNIANDGSILINGTANKTIALDRNSTANSDGKSLSIISGGATPGSTNKNAGDLILSADTATGSGSSKILFQTATPGASGTTDRVPTTKMTILGDGNVGIGNTSPSVSDGVGLHIGGKILRIDTSKTPASASDTGNIGELCWDSNYIYICVAANTWKRSTLSTW